MYTKEYVIETIGRIVEKYIFLFKKVVLFGSFARDEQKGDSDIDLFILSDVTTNKLLTSKEYNDFHDELYASFQNRIPFDLLVYGGKRDVRNVRSSTFYRNVLKDGIVLYDKGAETV